MDEVWPGTMRYVAFALKVSVGSTLGVFFNQSYDKALSYTLFAFVRAGNIEDAVKLCRDAHQPWRAASIRGSLLFSWPAICELYFADAAFATIWRSTLLHF